jgi:RHS repeat-associated protein
VLVSERTGGVSTRAYQYAGSTPIRTSSNGVAGWYHGDHVGSITNITGQTGTIEATYRYSPYGTTRSETVTPSFVSNPMKYTGQQQNPSGSYNLRARQYNPTLGSFTQTDPMPYGTGSVFESMYAYGYNNPYKFIDPNGERGFDPVRNPLSAARPLGVGIPGTNKCFRVPFGKTRCEKQKKGPADDALDSLVGDFVITATDAAGLKNASNVADIAKTYEDCRAAQNGPRCVRDVFFSTIGIIGAGGAAFAILGGPANQALFALVDYTTDFATGQFRVLREADDAIDKKATIRQLHRNGFEGVGSVRYWDGLPYWHAKGKNFWSASAERKNS